MTRDDTMKSFGMKMRVYWSLAVSYRDLDFQEMTSQTDSVKACMDLLQKGMKKILLVKYSSQNMKKEIKRTVT